MRPCTDCDKHHPNGVPQQMIDNGHPFLGSCGRGFENLRTTQRMAGKRTNG